MTVDDVKPEKNGDLTHNAKSGVNVNQLLSTFQNVFILVRAFAV